MNPEICEKLLLKMFFQQRNLHVHAVTSRIVIVLQRLEKDRKNLKRQKQQLILTFSRLGKLSVFVTKYSVRWNRKRFGQTLKQTSSRS